MDAISGQLGRVTLECMKQTIISVLRAWADVTQRSQVTLVVCVCLVCVWCVVSV